ncbi:MAG: tail fiber domain-containing protein [Candidatus Cloacimonadota bacterium]|nr:MAG: tail fiber domain-containing protein [Candidatus Cloacimonadota bacterium]
MKRSTYFLVTCFVLVAFLTASALSIDERIGVLETEIAELKTLLQKHGQTINTVKDDLLPATGPRAFLDGTRGWDENFTSIWTSVAPLPLYNVGIGTMSPQGKLHVQRDLAAGAELITLFNPSTSPSAYEFLRLGQSNVYWGILSYDNEDKELSLQSNINSSEGIALVTQTAAPIKFITGLTNERMRVNSDGNVGIGEASPQKLLHVNGDARFNNIWITDTPVPFIAFGASAEHGFIQYYDNSIDIVAKAGRDIRLGTDNSYDDVVIDTDGDVGIGTTTPWTKLEVAGHIRADAGALTNIEIWADCTNNPAWDYAGIALSNGTNFPATRLQVFGPSHSPPNEFHIRHYPDAPIIITTNNNERMRITGSGDVCIGTTVSSGFLLAVNGTAAKPGGGSWSTLSDIRLKHIHNNYERGLTEIAKINPVRYTYKKGNELELPTEQNFIGVVAQDIERIIPEAVEENDNGYLMINNDPIIWAMVNAIKELKSQNDELKKKIQQLEKYQSGQTEYRSQSCN